MKRPPLPPTLTVGDLQSYLRIGRRQAYELVNQAGFPAIRLGRSIRITRSALDQWLHTRAKEEKTQ